LKHSHVSKSIFNLMLCGLVMFSLSGCIYLVIGGIGAVGGYIVSPDTVEGITDNEYTVAWETAIEMISIMGLIEESNKEGGIIIASVHGANITISMMALSDSSTKVTVKARKAFLPRISLAQDVFVKIMSRLNE